MNAVNYRGFAEGLLEENDSVTLLSAALKMLIKGPEKASVEMTEAVRQGRYTKKAWGQRAAAMVTYSEKVQRPEGKRRVPTQNLISNRRPRIF